VKPRIAYIAAQFALVSFQMALTAEHHCAQQGAPKMPQSFARYFLVDISDTYMYTPDGSRPSGIIVTVTERDTGKTIISLSVPHVTVSGDVEIGRRVALTVTSLQSGNDRLIAAGVFVLDSDGISADGHEYKAVIRRLDGVDEIHQS
jgi:hypothetical protein